ncbi:MAG: bifunctional riboflavin kinase/FAD synthetase [Deltaproteobacteria bacterium]|nr:bifunctional riboflavin kinase/FAD synthetase [Deltaproteobacteria bacterium]
MRVILTHAQLYAEEFQALLRSSYVGVTVGNFDGFHLGHLALVRDLFSKTNFPSGLRLLLTFNPHPRVFLSTENQQRIQTRLQQLSELSLTTFRERVIEAEKLGFDVFIVAHFSKRFAQLTSGEFVKKYIVDSLHSRLVVVGHDFHFGKGREGNVDSLRSLGKLHGFETSIIPPCLHEGVRVSTSMIKQLLVQGEIALVNKFLGREYSIYGRVVSGIDRGKQLGFPTVNIQSYKYMIPAEGIYAAKVEYAGRRYLAACNIGKRPTFGKGSLVTEAHIIDYDGPALYGERIGLAFQERLRDEQRFSNEEELKAAISNDIEQVRSINSH